MEMDLEAMIEASFAVEDNLELDPQSSSLFEDSGVDGGSFSRHSNYHSSSANTLNQTTTSGSTNIKDIFYCENYFDLNDILAQSQRVSVKFQRDIPKLGFIDPASSSQEDLDIKKGTKLGLFCFRLNWKLRTFFVRRIASMDRKGTKRRPRNLRYRSKGLQPGVPRDPRSGRQLCESSQAGAQLLPLRAAHFQHESGGK